MHFESYFSKGTNIAKYHQKKKKRGRGSRPALDTDKIHSLLNLPVSKRVDSFSLPSCNFALVQREIPN